MSVQIGKNGESLALKRKRKKPKQRKAKKDDKVQTTLSVGDFMIKNIQGSQLAKAVGHRVVVKSFSGATSFCTSALTTSSRKS